MDAQRPPTSEQVFYRYESADGRVLLVDSLDKLPDDARPKAKRIVFEGSDQSALGGALTDLLGSANEIVSEPAAKSAASPIPLGLDAPSFVVGGASGVGLSLILWWLFASRWSFGKRIFVSLLLTGALAATLSAFYLGWLRRSTGQTDAMVATPSELINDAKRTMQLVEERRKEQERQLQELERVNK